MAAPDPKEVIALAEQIVTLEEKLTAARAKWNRLFNVTEPAKRVRASQDGLTAMVLQFIELNDDVAFAIPAVAQALKEDELPVGRTLYRLAKTGRIANPKRGVYTALKTLEAEDKTEDPGF